MLSLTAVKFVLLVFTISFFKSVDPVGYEILSFDRYLEMRKHLDDMVGERLAAGSVLLLPTILSWFVLSNYGVCYAYEGFFCFRL